MSGIGIESVAFEQAHLKSERLRLLIVLGAIGIAFLMRSTRVLAHSGDENVQGLPLGILPHLVSGPPEIVEPRPGDMLVLATDGFFEWANPKGDEFGVRRIREIIRLAREKPPREIISALYQAVIEFSEGTHQQDDFIAVVVKRV